VTAAPPQADAATPPPRAAGGRPFRWTREQYYRLGELGFFDGRRVERIRGEIVEMSPINWPHTLAKGKVADALRAAFAGTGWVNEQAPFPTEDSDPEPDVGVYPGRRDDYADHPTDPLLLVEVSDATLDRDLTVKAELYASAGVPDYWVLDLTHRRLHVFRDPQPLPEGLGATAYRTRLTLGPADAVSPLAAPASRIPVADLLP
jgi:Uma2 family endonuclease